VKVRSFLSIISFPTFMSPLHDRLSLSTTFHRSSNRFPFPFESFLPRADQDLGCRLCGNQWSRSCTHWRVARTPRRRPCSDSLDSTDYGQRIERPRKRDDEGYQCTGIYHTFHSLKDASARTFVDRQWGHGGRKRKTGNVASWS